MSKEGRRKDKQDLKERRIERKDRKVEEGRKDGRKERRI